VQLRTKARVIAVVVGVAIAVVAVAVFAVVADIVWLENEEGKVSDFRKVSEEINIQLSNPYHYY